MIIITQDGDKFAYLGVGRGPKAKNDEKGEGKLAFFVGQIPHFSVITVKFVRITGDGNT